MIAKLEGYKVLNNKARAKHIPPPPPEKMGVTISNKSATTESPPSSATGGGGGGGGLYAFYWYQIFALDYVVVKTQTLFTCTSHEAS